MVQIYPSMLSANPAKLGEALESVEKSGADGIHWDIMDGSFVESITFGAHILAALRPLSSLRFDAHLMVENPERHLETFAEAGADSIIVHPETTKHLHRILDHIKNNLGKKSGIALNPATSLECLNYCLDLVDIVLIMSVNPGSSGQKFIESQIQKIEILKGVNSVRRDSVNSGIGGSGGIKTVEVCVDGGINPETAPRCIKAGADSLVSGSFIFKSGDYAKAMEELR